MPTLEWIGKDKVVNHLDGPYRVLDRKYSFDEVGRHDRDNGSENMIIHGDNLDALKSPARACDRVHRCCRARKQESDVSTEGMRIC